MSSAVAERLSFDRRAADAKISKTDINYAIMDYLISEGYPDAAEKFAIEANMQPPPTDLIQDRVNIRNAILKGDIASAIDSLNELDPDILDRDATLHFALLRLQLIELIRPCTNSSSDEHIGAVLEFAQNSLAPRAPQNPKFLEDLECTMALLIYCDTASMPPMLAGLLEPELRHSVAQMVNEAIHLSQCRAKHPRLRSIIKLRTWAERKARLQGRDLGPSTDIWTDSVPAASEDAVMSTDNDADGLST